MGQKASLLVTIAAVIGILLSATSQSASQQDSNLCPREQPGHEGWIKMLQCVLKEAQSGNARAAYLLGRMYDASGSLGSNDDREAIGLPTSSGYSRAFDVQQAAYWYDKAANAGNVPAMQSLFNLGQVNSNLLNEADGVAWLKKAAATGDVQSMSDICGYSVNKSHDYIEALRDCTLAANKNDQGAQFMLGRIYSEGLGIQKNHTLAAQWLQRAASGPTESLAKYASDELNQMKTADATAQHEQQAKRQEAAQAAALETNFKKFYLNAKLQGGEKPADLHFGVSFNPGGWVRLIKITSHEDEPLRVYKVVINRHYDNQSCSPVRDLSGDYLVLQTVSLGNTVEVGAPGLCDDPVKVEVFTDKGVAEYDFN